MLPGSVIALRQSFLRQSEVEDLNVPSLIKDDVRGLYIAMNNAVRMCLSKSFGDLDGDVERLPNVPPPPPDHLGHRLAFDVFHGDKRNVTGLVYLVNRADVWVV